MQARYENIKFKNNGVIYPFNAQVQRIYGQQTVAGAHYHEYIEILYCTKGSFYIQLDCENYHLNIGDMVIINSMEVHYSLALNTEDNEYLVIRFKPELLYTTNQTLFEARYVLPFTMKSSTHQKLFIKSEIESTFIPTTLKNIIHEDLTKEYGFELSIRTGIGQIFLWILRRWNKMGLDLNLSSGLDHTNIERFEKVLSYIDTHYFEPISINDMSTLVNMSYSYFSRLFKSTMDRNFSDYVNHVRVSKAEYLLVTTDNLITDIALEVGFTTSSYFIEQFKHFKSITPKQYRQLFMP